MNLKHFIRMGYAEGVSALVLFFIAMPMKYMLDMPMAVKIVGNIHGFLFVIYAMMIAFYGMNLKWRVSTMLLLFLASILPGGPFFAEGKILKREKKA